MVATTMEAVMGAVYLDGEERVWKGVMRGLGVDDHVHL
jgi:dsRNA-specific ribonuclease